MVDHLCEETPLEACDGMGVAWSRGDYSDSPLAHRDEFHGEVHSSRLIFDRNITRAGSVSRIVTGLFLGILMSFWSCPWD
jgi:hypothetical protein